MNNGSGFLEIPLLDDTFSFFNGEDLVHAHVSNFIDNTIGPAYFDEVYFSSLLEAKMQSQIALGNIASAASDLIDLGQISRNDFDFRSDAVAIAFDTDGVVDKVTNVSVNKILTVKEGKGIVEQ